MPLAARRAASVDGVTHDGFEVDFQMLSRIVSGLVGVLIGYGGGALLGAGLVALASANTHDKSQEVVTTALLIAGPIGALIGLVAGLLRKQRRQHGPSPPSLPAATP